MKATATFLVMLLVAGCGGSGGVTRLTVGSPLPDFSLPSLDGAKVESASFDGKMLVLNFWATWCQPCLKEIPELRALSVDDRLEVVGVALDEEGEAAVRPFVERHQMDYTILLGDQEVFQRMGGFSIPYTLLVDDSRQVVAIYRGPATKDDIEAELRRLEGAA